MAALALTPSIDRALRQAAPIVLDRDWSLRGFLYEVAGIVPGSAHGTLPQARQAARRAGGTVRLVAEYAHRRHYGLWKRIVMNPVDEAGC